MKVYVVDIEARHRIAIVAEDDEDLDAVLNREAVIFVRDALSYLDEIGWDIRLEEADADTVPRATRAALSFAEKFGFDKDSTSAEWRSFLKEHQPVVDNRTIPLRLVYSDGRTERVRKVRHG